MSCSVTFIFPLSVCLSVFWPTPLADMKLMAAAVRGVSVNRRAFSACSKSFSHC